MKLLPVLAAVICSLTAAAAAESPSREAVEKFMAAGRASEVNASDNAYGQQVIETLTALLLQDPAEAQKYFLKARVQIAAERAAKGTSKPGEGGERHRSVSALGAALGAALQRVEKELKPGDERLPKVIGAVAAMLAADEGCGVEGNESVRFHTGVMMHKAGQTADGKFSVQLLMEKLAPEVKDEWLPVLLGAARHMTWGLMRDDAAGHLWLATQAEIGAHRPLARLLLAAARISKMEKDAANKQRSGILDKTKLREEQTWLLELMEKKTVPPAALAACGAEILRLWPTAEPPLRYACAHALAEAWQKDVPVNTGEAATIVRSLTDLLKGGKAPADEGFSAAAKALAAAWEKRLELNRTPLYGWPAAELKDDTLAGMLYLIARETHPDAARHLLSFSTTETARDPSLVSIIRLSESFQLLRLYEEAAGIIASITPEQGTAPEADADRRMQLSIKRYHIPLNAAGAPSIDAAVKATIALLKDRNDDPSAWTAVGWSWSNWGRDLKEAGKNKDALLCWCMSCAFAHAADRYAHDTHGTYQPPSEAKCREELKALNFSPDKISVLRTRKGLETLLESFDGEWKDLPEAVKKRLMDGVNAK